MSEIVYCNLADGTPNSSANGGSYAFRPAVAGEVRRIGLDRTHSILVDWVPVPTVEFTKEADRVHAHIMEIPPGIGVTLRVVSISARGYESEPSTPMQFFVPRKEAIFTVQRLLLALFALIIVGALWLRNQVNVPMRGE